MDLQAAARELRILFDAHAYLTLYPDVRVTGMDPVEHYLRFGAEEGRQPCAQFDGTWYRARYADIAASDLNPLLHYIRHGGAELRDPNPRFNAAYYVDAHPEATGNPLLYHLLHGHALGWATEPQLPLDALLPNPAPIHALPADIVVDVVIPVYRGRAQTIRCIEAVLADPIRPPGRILVVDDHTPEPELAAWLQEMARQNRITLLQNARNLGFVRSVNRGMRAAGRADVVLLNSDTEVPAGWLTRLARAAYADSDIATVSPFSNNATICSYPNAAGGTMPAGLQLAEIDSACHTANAGRSVAIPTTVGFCMYIRRTALDMAGEFDASTFGRGYGEEVDFCLRATRLGWRHALACDVFVYHEGEVSFGAASPHARKGAATLQARYPDYADLVARHARLDPALPARFAVTAALFRASQLPGILFISHGHGGGVRRHMLEMIDALRGHANVLLLQPDMHGVALSVPAIAGHPILPLAAERAEDLALYLRSAGIQRAHLHHVMGIGMDIRALLRHLDVAFDLTLHDYYGICPQINFLPTLDAQYCGEPGARHCNACIAANPGHGALDIDSWRWQHAWMFHAAARVLCPSEDAHARLARHGLAKNAIVAPHEAVLTPTWPMAPVHIDPHDTALRVALLGVLADRKGLPTVAAVAELAGPDIALHVIGHPEYALDPTLSARLIVSGAYDEADLPALIADIQPHIFWFPAQWPETYSYTLSAAIAAGGAIVAADLGAFSERLRNRPLTWLVPPGAPAQDWLHAFAAARQALRAKAGRQTLRADTGRHTSRADTGRHTSRADTGRRAQLTRALATDYYPDQYLQPLRKPAPRPRKKNPAPRILVLPETLAHGLPSPCGYIRLLQPLHHPAISAGRDIRVGDLTAALTETADVIITQRHALDNLDDIAALQTHCRARNIRLIYDLDDDLLALSEAHPDAAHLRPLAPMVQAMLAAADTIWVSTPALVRRLGHHRAKALVVENGLDERLWWPPAAADRALNGPLRLLCMGTGTHGADLALILPALTRLQTEFGARVAIDIIGITSADLPPGLQRIDPPSTATYSYPAFINWLSQHDTWHLGLAPLADTPFNQGKSAIKAMDYAGLGIPTIASDIGVYNAAITDGINGMLVANTETAWFAALAGLLRDPNRRQQMAVAARSAFQERFSLAAQATTRKHALTGR